MLFTIEPLQASEGDCLLLHWGTVADPKLAVIDGGPGRTWESNLQPRLEQIAHTRNLERLVVDLAMVSHVDLDHIVGIKKLFRARVAELDGANPPLGRRYDIRRLWHNTFNDVLGDAVDRYYQTLTATLTASVDGQPNPALERDLAQAYEANHPTAHNVHQTASEVAHDVALVLAGHGDGRELRDNHAKLRNANQIAALNHPYMHNAHPTLITPEAQPGPGAVSVAGLDITVVGPLDDDIERLQIDFDKYIVKKGLTAEALLAAYADPSVTNLSSIVCLVELDGKTILLTGDARGDKILIGLHDAGLLDGNGHLHADVLKVPHHGSDNNVSQGFFESISADAYILSGNGKHGNPERSAVEWIIDSRHPNDTYTLVFTYPIAEIDEGRRRDAGRHNHPWHPATDALAPMLDQRVQGGHQFTIVEGAPHQVSLGDEQPTW